jgi:tetratricopeptide (TPR) repeat protein
MKNKAKPGAAGAPRRSSASEAARLVDIGLASAKTGTPGATIKAFTEALRHNPQSLDAHMNLGIVFAKLQKQQSATKHLQRALALAPGHPEVRIHAGASFEEIGRYDLALESLGHARAARPDNVFLLDTLGSVLLEIGRFDDAIGVLERAVALDPKLARGHYNLHRALYAARGPAASLPAIAKSVQLAPTKLLPQLALATALGDAGDLAGAREVFDGFGPGDYPGAKTSWEYVLRNRGPNVPNFATTRETLHFAMDRARVEGLVLEFGVCVGASTRWLAEKAPAQVHGFDSFEGLPEAWHSTAAGQYTTHGEPPEVPSNVKLHVGLFDATLPAFIAQHPEPIRFVNVDCDLYSSTKTVFDALSDRIVPGSVLVFDEYLVNDAWTQDEYKAFQEAVTARGWRYEYLAFSLLNGQAAVRIL